MAEAVDRLQDLFSGGALVATSDVADLPRFARALYIGVAGALKVDTLESQTITFPNVVAGVFPVKCRRVYTTGTAATGIVALW